ncbi:MAG: NTP transferase domain-containing protein, partial [Acidobacteria bacterium]|nr:NTP transferase domain-containing protein [Acidobacteriota bacterium]
MTAVKSAIVLAAGQGERMRPLTLRVPKPLVPLAGRPLIDHVLDRLREAGVETAIVNVHYLPDLLEAHLRKRIGGP